MLVILIYVFIAILGISINIAILRFIVRRNIRKLIKPEYLLTKPLKRRFEFYLGPMRQPLDK